MGAVLVYNTLSNQITQQTNQIGILKAIGARSRTIVGVFLVSTFIFGLLALILALPLGALVAFGVARTSWTSSTSISIRSSSPQRRHAAGRRCACHAAAGGVAADSAGRRHDRPAGDRQLRPGRHLWRQPDRSGCGSFWGKRCCLPLCHRPGQHVPAQGPAADDGDRAGHGRQCLPDGDGPQLVHRR